MTTPSGRKVQLVGVQTQRQSGMAWGQIAHSIGVKLGAVVSAAKSAGKHHDHEYAMRSRTDGEEHRHSTPYAQSTHDTRTLHATHNTGGIQRTSTTHTMHALPGDTSHGGGAGTGGGAGGGAGGGTGVGAGGGHGHSHK